MKKVLLTVLLFVFLAASNSYAACTGGPVDWISTPDESSVDTCVGNLTSGDTLTVASGSASWGNRTTINTDNVTIQGQTTGCPDACVSGTTLTGSAGFIIDSTDGVRITGLSFKGSGAVFRWNNAINFRIDNNEINGPSSFNNKGNRSKRYGVIDNNYVYDLGLEGAYAMGDGNQAWTDAGTGGGFNDGTVYWENNIFVTIGEIGNVFDAGEGARQVFRFNTFDETAGFMGSLFASHGHCWGQRDGSNNAGLYISEIYENTFTGGARDWGSVWRTRGGRGYFFNNTITGSGYGSIISLQNYESTQSCSSCGVSAHESMGVPSGHTLPWGGNCSSYPCPMQINNLYIWDNTHNGGNISVTKSTSHIAEDRDYWFDDGNGGVSSGTWANRPGSCDEGEGYWATDQGSWNAKGADGMLYRCNDSNQWVMFYEPYPYPHPLSSGALPPPSNLRIVK